MLAVYVIYWKGPVLRKRSPFAQQLEDARQHAAQEVSTDGPLRPMAIRAHSFARSQQELSIRHTMGSRQGSSSRVNSRINSRVNSRANSRVNSRRNSLEEAEE